MHSPQLSHVVTPFYMIEKKTSVWVQDIKTEIRLACDRRRVANEKKRSNKIKTTTSYLRDSETSEFFLPFFRKRAPDKVSKIKDKAVNFSLALYDKRKL